MGSLASRPKVPQVRPVVVQQVAAPSPVTSVPAAADKPSETDKPAGKPTQSEVRSDDLLRRARGSFGTVLTSFRGLERTQANNGQGRKTLLGE